MTRLQSRPPLRRRPRAEAFAARIRAAALVVAAVLLASCGVADEERGEAAAAAAPERPVYAREFLFAGMLDTLPVAANFAFEARTQSAGEQRAVRAWLARGGAWDAFLDESWHAPPAASVWQVLPRGPLRVAARSATDPEAIWYDHEGRSLRLTLRGTRANWARGGDVQVRVHPGTLTLGTETIRGPVLEVLRVRREASATEARDWLVLTSGDSVRLVLAHARGGPGAAGQTFAWLARAGQEQGWETVQVEWPAVRPLDRARRDVPAAWRFQVPEAGLRGQVEALGSDERLGEERGGRRPAEVRSTVRGWIELQGGERIPVQGVVRHAQG